MKNLVPGNTGRALVILVALFATAPGALAQESEPTPLMRAMALVPAADIATDPAFYVTFADTHAGIASRGLGVPGSWAEYEAAGAPRDILYALPPGLPSEIATYVVLGGPDYPEANGFDFFDLTQTVEFGHPHERAMILLGAFDPGAVTAAFSARGYEVHETDGPGTLLCTEEGCDSGAPSNLLERTPATPFGGSLGRRYPVVLGDGAVLGSPSLARLQQLAATYGGQTTSLADLAEVRAIDAALANYPHVTSALLVNLATMRDNSAALLETSLPGVAAADRAELAPLPPYTLAVFAGTADEDGEYGLAIIAYRFVEVARIAAGVLDARLAALSSMVTDASYAELYGQVGTLEPAQVVTDDASGVALVVVRIASELPPRADAQGDAIWTPMPVARFFDGLARRDLAWLAPGGVP